MEKGNFQKYFLYVVGEILLIIIGILIALSVAEWNNNRNDRDYEKSVLTKINNDLEREIGSLNQTLSLISDRMNKLVILDSLFNEEMPSYSNSMDTLFGASLIFFTFSIEKSQYQNLKSIGLNIIRSDSLRDQLATVYEKGNFLIEKRSQIEEKLYLEITLPYHLANFKDYRSLRTATPINYDKLWNDPYYNNMINHRVAALNMCYNNFSGVKSNMVILRRMIQEYLKE